MQHFTKTLTVISFCVAALTLSACGTPAIAVNPYSPGAAVAVAGATTPTSVSVASAVSGMESMPGMTNPTGTVNPTGSVPAIATSAVTLGPSPTELVIDWLLYGTPTATPNGVAQSSQMNSSQPAVTPTQYNAQNPASPISSNAQNTAPIVTFVPPTASQPSVTSIPTTTAGVTVTVASAPAASANTGDPARGQALFQGAATCSSCHDVANGVTIVGPSLKHIASIAGTQVSGQDAATRLRHAILTPNEFVYPGFAPNIMPQTFGQTLNAQQIDDLVAYLLTLK